MCCIMHRLPFSVGRMQIIAVVSNRARPYPLQFCRQSDVVIMITDSLSAYVAFTCANMFLEHCECRRRVIVYVDIGTSVTTFK